MIKLQVYLILSFFFNMKNGVDPLGRSMEKPRSIEDAVDKTKPWQLAEIVEPVHCRLVAMPDSSDTSSKVLLLIIICC